VAADDIEAIVLRRFLWHRYRIEPTMTVQELVRDLTQNSMNGRLSSAQSEKLAEVLSDYLERLERGDKPNTSAIVAQHPELAAELHENLAKLAALHYAAVGMTDGGEMLDQLCAANLSELRALGDFRLIRPIGRGGMGVVYEAEQISLKRRVALKILPLAAVLDPKQLARFKNEAQAAASLDHPHIVSVYAVGSDRGVHYYAMQFIEGLSLAEAVEKLGARSVELGAGDCGVEEQKSSGVKEQTCSYSTTPLLHSCSVPPSETRCLSSLSTERSQRPADYFRSVAQLGIQAAEALHYAHEMGVVHRDVKPSNLLLDNDGQLYVADFGLAITASGSELTMTGDLLGTLRFMSPEQAAGRRALVDRRTDIYSLGASLYELATLQPAFPEEDRVRLLQQIVTDPPQVPSQINYDIPKDLETIILKAMAKEPSSRYETAQELADDLGRFIKLEPIRARRISKLEHARSWCRRNKAVASLAAAVAAAAIVVGVSWTAWRMVNVSWARQHAPVIDELALAGRTFDAYDLAVRVRNYLPDEPTPTLMSVISDTLSVTSDPRDARVYLKRFVPGPASEAPPPTLVGTTPISKLEVARGSYIVSVEKEGFEPFQRTWSNVISGSIEAPILFPPVEIVAILTPAAKAPAGMVFVPGGEYRLDRWSRLTEAKVNLHGYFIDEFEVSNHQYKEFVDARGYLNVSYWTRPFVKDGRTLAREEALRELVDSTGQPGPRHWSRGTYSEGKADHPVTNITWYEAAAYAAFRGKSLPTIFQWEKSARYGANTNPLGVTMPWGMQEGLMAGRANLSTSGTIPVGSMEFGMSPFGCYDMAGNVAEWCLNETSEGFITSGGSWASNPLAWGYYGKAPGFRHSDEVGFRCVLSPAGAAGDQGAMWIDLDDQVPQLTPAPGAEVKTWFAHYEYDRDVPLDERVESTETDEWRRERITYNGADGQRSLAYLYIPKHFPGPHQVIHLRPAGDVGHKFRTVPQSIEADYGSFVRSGRAVFAVVLSGYPERETPTGLVAPNPASIEFVEANAREIVDMRRGLDYLLARDDVDAGGIAFLGVSFGGGHMVLPAIESRYRAVVLAEVFIANSVDHPAANAVNFAPLIQAPKLLVHGRYDEANPLKTMAEPLFNLITEPKKMVVYDGGHRPDSEYRVQVVNSWLDETLGPVKQK
jgi:serine/threonine protein kinase/formylglycine-generating enzyme required for sulfatase activity/cephalosporin-C deacetylase-like acetyl esterase